MVNELQDSKFKLCSMRRKSLEEMYEWKRRMDEVTNSSGKPAGQLMIGTQVSDPASSGSDTRDEVAVPLLQGAGSNLGRSK